MLYIVHTAPDHSQSRSILRLSWTSNRINFNKTRTSFVIGKPNDALKATIKKEYNEFNDTFMHNLDDTNPNMTFKVDIYFDYYLHYFYGLIQYKENICFEIFVQRCF